MGENTNIVTINYNKNNYSGRKKSVYVGVYAITKPLHTFSIMLMKCNYSDSLK